MELTTSTISLPAIEPHWVQEIRADQHLLPDIAHAVRGPFHVLFPACFPENINAFRAALADAGVEGEIYFGKKANKASCWLSSCAETNAGVDVASVPELVHTLGHGIRGGNVMITGAAKSEKLLWLAARHGCLIAVDALDELERVISVARSNMMIRILLRVLPNINPYSRFGLSEIDLDHALTRCSYERERVIMEGFSFHMNGYEIAPRVSLASDLVDRCVEARSRGLIANSISIGGGFAISYLDAADWRRFKENYQDSWFHGNKTFTHFYP
ncbi:MAG TPA: Y4yA family PLP-dependent enzyme, partial [Pseudonocardiaceae bacterium]|nr:Y4yA family PLP-dependent enzyme [Pseudonocardiaceae bacterium]